MREKIRHILKEETSNPVNTIKRRLDVVDWMVEFSVRDIQRQHGDICNVKTADFFVEIVIEKVGDGMYWDHFADAIDDYSPEWTQMYRFIEKYVEHKFGDKLRQHYHMQCGD